MIHQPLIGGNGISGQQTDIQIHAEHMLRTREKLERIMAENSGHTYEEMHAACERDNYLTAEDALKFGLIDKVFDKRA